MSQPCKRLPSCIKVATCVRNGMQQRSGVTGRQRRKPAFREAAIRMEVLVDAAQHIFCWRQRLTDICVHPATAQHAHANQANSSAASTRCGSFHAAMRMPCESSQIAAELSYCCEQGFGLGGRAHHLWRWQRSPRQRLSALSRRHQPPAHPPLPAVTPQRHAHVWLSSVRHAS